MPTAARPEPRGSGEPELVWLASARSKSKGIHPLSESEEGAGTHPAPRPSSVRSLWQTRRSIARRQQRAVCRRVPRRLQGQHALVGAARPRAGTVGEGGHVGPVDEHVDLVEHGADGGLPFGLSAEGPVGVSAVAQDVATAARAEGEYKGEQPIRLRERFASEHRHPVSRVRRIEQLNGQTVHRHGDAAVRVPGLGRDASSYHQSGSIYRRALRDRWRLHVATRRRPFGDGDRSAKPVPALACVALRRPMQAWTGRGEIRRRTDRRPARRSGLPCGWRAGRGRRSPLATGLSRTAGTGR
jgi:hypothetical protein